MVARAQACRERFLAAIHDPSDDKEWAREEVACALRRVISRLDTRKAEERHAEAKAERLRHCVPLPDGMAGIWSTHTAADAEAMFAQLAEAARKIDDGRTMDKRRADTLRDLVLGRMKAGTPARGMRVQVLVRQDTADGSSDLPGEPAGYGPIPASQVREIMADQSSRIDRVLVASAGRVIPECGIDDRPGTTDWCA